MEGQAKRVPEGHQRPLHSIGLGFLEGGLVSLALIHIDAETGAAALPAGERWPDRGGWRGRQRLGLRTGASIWLVLLGAVCRSMQCPAVPAQPQGTSRNSTSSTPLSILEKSVGATGFEPAT